MKKIILPVVLSAIALTAIGTAIISCEKKEIAQSTSSQSTIPTKPGKGDIEKLMPPSGSVTLLSGICGQITCAPPGFAVFSKNNHFKVVKDAYTIANYPANMHYTFYIKGTHISGNLYNIDSVYAVNCSQNAPEFARSTFLNSTQYYVRITETTQPNPPAHDVIDIATPSPLIPFTTGTDLGQPC